MTEPSLRIGGLGGAANRMTDTTSINQRMNGSEWLALLLLLSVLWGGSFFFAGVLIRTLPPLTIVLLRVGLAALILNVLLKLTPADGRAWRAFFAMGLLNNVVPFCLVVWGQSHIASGLAAILNATTPISTVIVAHLFTSYEKMTGNRLLGIHDRIFRRSGFDRRGFVEQSGDQSIGATGRAGGGGVLC